MNVITLHVLSTCQSADFGLQRLAAPALEPDARVMVFEGLPPQSAPIHPTLAPVVLQGDLDGHRVYAEQVPDGVLLSEITPPASLISCIGLSVLEAVLALLDAGLLHGRIHRDRVIIGTEGEVVLFGRGRIGGSPDHDMEGAAQLLAELGMTIERDADIRAVYSNQRVAADPTDRQALASLVRKGRPEPEVASHVHLRVGPTPDSLDEVQPNLGPDEATGPGLLDRWAIASTDGEEYTAELTGSIGETTSPLTLTLWTALAAPSEHVPATDRFEGVAGEASRGLRALLVAEAPDSLPGLGGSSVTPFLMEVDPDTDNDFEDSDDTHPDVTDEDGDTAIYDTRDRELQEAIRKSDARTRIKELQAQVDDAEKRAYEAELRAEAAEREARQSPSPPPPAGSFPRTEWIMGAVLIGLIGLVAWLAWLAFT